MTFFVCTPWWPFGLYVTAIVPDPYVVTTGSTAYAGILASMFATSTTLRRSTPAPVRRKILLGTTLFLASALSRVRRGAGCSSSKVSSIDVPMEYNPKSAATPVMR